MKEIYVNIKIVILTPSQNQTVCNMAMEKNIYLLKFDENCFTNVGSLYNVISLQCIFIVNSITFPTAFSHCQFFYLYSLIV